VMSMTDELRESVLSGATALELKRAAINGGMVTLRQAGLVHVSRGLTTIEEVLRVTMSD
jgi:type IV pilus assembly protein PilB